MSLLARLLHVLRKGPKPQRVQAWIGVALLFAAFVWLLLNLWIILALFAGAVTGVILIARSLRDAPSSSSA